MGDLCSSSEDATRAVLLGSRSASRRRASSATTPTGLYSPSSTIIITESGSRYPLSVPSVASKKSKVSKVDLLVETSSNLSGNLSISSDDREDVKDLLAPGQYAALPAARVPRDQWIPGYSSPAPRSSVRDVFSRGFLIRTSSQLHQCRCPGSGFPVQAFNKADVFSVLSVRECEVVRPPGR